MENEEEHIEKLMAILRNKYLATRYDHDIHWRDMAIAALEYCKENTNA